MGTIKEYRSRSIVVYYDAKRCIHAGECAQGLPQVFDPAAEPWVSPDAASAQEIAEVVSRCPTGALHAEWQGRSLTPASTNQARLCAAGPVCMRGEIEIIDAGGQVVLQDERVALCRCGASENKPYCDGSHAKAGFADPGILQPIAGGDTPAVSGKVMVTATADGPLRVDGPLELYGADGGRGYAGEQCFLCRCGASKNKPFCDGSHKRIRFRG